MSGGFYLFRIMLYPASLVWWFVIVSSSGRPFWFELLLPQSRICECMMIFLKMKSQTFCSCIQLLDGPLLSTVSRILQNARARYLVWMNVAGKEVAKAPKNDLVHDLASFTPGRWKVNVHRCPPPSTGGLYWTAPNRHLHAPILGEHRRPTKDLELSAIVVQCTSVDLVCPRSTVVHRSLVGPPAAANLRWVHWISLSASELPAQSASCRRPSVGPLDLAVSRWTT